MKIFDSTTRKIYELANKDVSLYNCGPTVYNDIHIGNARPLIIFDLLYRVLVATKYNVKYVQNITDIDDKIINKAKQENSTESNVSKLYTQHFLEVMAALNVLPMTMPKVSENIPAMIEFIKSLIEKQYAYVTEQGNVYFITEKAKDYGMISHQNIEQLKSGVRKELNDDKKSPLDFVLWKKTTEGLNWESPWSFGRPGWHTECVVFINKFIGDQVTIHGGGVDLKFPHHENENAQNIALNQKPLAKIWLHVGHINNGSDKMSKSIGNFVLAKDIIQEFGGNALRWFLYQTKYQNPIDYSQELLKESNNNLTKITQQINAAAVQLFIQTGEKIIYKKIISNEFIDCLNDDLNTPNAITIITRQAKEISNLIKQKDFEGVKNQYSILISEFNVIGITYNNPIEDEIILSELIEWKSAMERKDYIVADKYRDILKQKGIL